MIHPSITSLLELGDRMCAALEEGDVDTFSDLIRMRGELVRNLADQLDSDTVTSEEAVKALSDQHIRLEQAMNASRAGLSAAVGAVSRFRSARRAYGRPVGPPDGKLNKSLQG